MKTVYRVYFAMSGASGQGGVALTAIGASMMAVEMTFEAYTAVLMVVGRSISPRW